MKQVFKCDYCSKMGTEEEIREHELNCKDNYDRRSCYTCAHKKTTVIDGQWRYECKNGEEIPEGCRIEFCNKYERKESTNELGGFGDIIGSLFGR